MTRKVGRIRDVAQATGLSTATISRVMNGADNVSPETRRRVLEACDALNYLPNPAARALTTKRSKTIAAIIPSIEHSIFAQFIAAIEQTLAEHGYSLVLAISRGSEENELKAARKLLGMGAEAIILSGAAHSPSLTQLFARRNIPYVFTSIWDPESAVPTIGYDNFALARDAVSFLTKMGHRRIAALHGSLTESDRTRARRTGAEKAQGGGVTIDFFETSLDVAGGRSTMRSVLETGETYTATICFSDVLALGAYFSLLDAGLRIPQDMSLMGFDNLDWSSATVPGLTSINLPTLRMGVNVASQLVEHLESGDPVASTKLEGELVERGSVANISSA